MNSRERFLKILNFERCDRTLKWELGYWGGTLLRWYKEGLEEKENINRKLQYIETIFSTGQMYPGSYDNLDKCLFAYKISAKFNFDKGPSAFPFNWIYCPKYKKEIVDELEDKIIYIDDYGIKKMVFKNDEKCLPMFLEHPVKNESDWESLVEARLNINNFNERYTINNIENFISKDIERDYPLALYGSPIGFFHILRQMIGEENLYYWYYDKPDLLKKILNYLCKFWLNIAEELTSKVEFDYGDFGEDICYNKGCLVSPEIFEEFMAPYYKKLIDFAKSKKIRHFILDSDGYVENIISMFKNVGITGFLPFEIRAGNDIERIRKNYPDLVIFGGIDKTALNNKENIDNELEKVKRMIKKGGYIPYIDHGVPPDISWENYKYYREKLNYIIDSIKIDP